MAEIINLNKARKAKARAEAKSTAAANRAANGRSRADRKVSEIEKRRVDRLLDGAKREDD